MKLTLTLFLTFFGVLTFAQTKYYVNGQAHGQNDGSSWEDAFVQLQDAFDTAQSGDDIWIAQGTYLPPVDTSLAERFFKIRAGIRVYGGFSGSETSLDQRDVANNIVQLSGDVLGDDLANDFISNKSDNTYHVLWIHANDSEVVFLSDLHIRNGNALTDTDPNDLHSGGGILAYSRIEIAHCTFSQNFARRGGAVCCVGEGTNESLIKHSSFAQNMASQQGAGIFMQDTRDIVVDSCSVTENFIARGAIYPLFSENTQISNTTFSRNTCNDPTAYGGALFIWGSRNISLTNCTISESTCGNGSGIYVDGREAEEGSTSLVISSCQFQTNNALGYGGAAIFNWAANMDISNTLFKNNTANNTGGSIYANGTGKTITIEDCAFEDNTATGGWGAAMGFHGDTTNVYVRRCSFTNNTASTSGGAMTCGFEAHLEVEDCIFEGNMAQFGGALHQQNDSTTLSVKGSQFEGNTATVSGGAILVGGGATHHILNNSFELNVSQESGGAISILDVDETDTDTSNVTVSSNTFIENIADLQGGGIFVSDANVQFVNNLFANNVIYGDFGGAISHNAGMGGTSFIRLVNNTFYENIGAEVAGLASYADVNGMANVEFQNNIFYHSLALDVGTEDGSPSYESMGGNLVNELGLDFIFDGAQDDFEKDPLFIDPDNLNFCLQDNSPCVNTGIDANAPTTDAFGNPRLGKTDKGFCENQNVVATEDTYIIPSRYLATPNPATHHVTLETIWTGGNQWVKLEVIGISGQTLQAYDRYLSKGKNEFSLSVAALPKGQYGVRIQGRTINAHTSFVKI